MSNGWHSLQAQARDAAGNIGQTVKIYLYVNNPMSGGGGSTTTISETESNDFPSRANLVAAANTTITGTVSSLWDVDYFIFTLPAAKKATVSLTSPSGLDYNLSLTCDAGYQSSSQPAGVIDQVSLTNTSTIDSSCNVSVYNDPLSPEPDFSTTSPYTLKIVW